MSKFKREASYEEQGEKVETGSRDGRRVIVANKKECPITYHVETRQIVNPLNPYEICDSEEGLARSIAGIIAEAKKAQKNKGGR